MQSIVWNYYIQPYKCCLKCMPYFIVRINNRHIIFRPSRRAMKRPLWEFGEKLWCYNWSVRYIKGYRKKHDNHYIHKHLVCFPLNPFIYQTTRCMCLVKNQFVFKYVVYDFVVKVMPLSWKYVYIAIWYYVMVYCNFPLQKKQYRYALQWSTYSNSTYLRAFNRTYFGHFVFGVLTPWYKNLNVLFIRFGYSIGDSS